jgi:hypothetical protein
MQIPRQLPVAIPAGGARNKELFPIRRLFYGPDFPFSI